MKFFGETAQSTSVILNATDTDPGTYFSLDELLHHVGHALFHNAAVLMAQVFSDCGQERRAANEFLRLGELSARDIDGNAHACERFLRERVDAPVVSRKIQHRPVTPRHLSGDSPRLVLCLLGV